MAFALGRRIVALALIFPSPAPVSLAAILFLGFAPCARSNESDECRGLDRKVVTLIDQSKELRDHGGKLHRVLQALGTELGHRPYTTKMIVACLGEADAIRNDARMAGYLGIYQRESGKSGREMRPKQGREYLVYHWRGGHDFLFFITEGGLIVDKTNRELLAKGYKRKLESHCSTGGGWVFGALWQK